MARDYTNQNFCEFGYVQPANAKDQPVTNSDIITDFSFSATNFTSKSPMEKYNFFQSKYFWFGELYNQPSGNTSSAKDKSLIWIKFGDGEGVRFENSIDWNQVTGTLDHIAIKYNTCFSFRINNKPYNFKTYPKKNGEDYQINKNKIGNTAISDWANDTTILEQEQYLRNSRPLGFGFNVELNQLDTVRLLYNGLERPLGERVRFEIEYDTSANRVSITPFRLRHQYNWYEVNLWSQSPENINFIYEPMNSYIRVWNLNTNTAPIICIATLDPAPEHDKTYGSFVRNLSSTNGSAPTETFECGKTSYNYIDLRKLPLKENSSTIRKLTIDAITPKWSTEYMAIPAVLTFSNGTKMWGKNQYEGYYMRPQTYKIPLFSARQLSDQISNKYILATYSYGSITTKNLTLPAWTLPTFVNSNTGLTKTKTSGNWYIQNGNITCATLTEDGGHPCYAYNDDDKNCKNDIWCGGFNLPTVKYYIPELYSKIYPNSTFLTTEQYNYCAASYAHNYTTKANVRMRNWHNINFIYGSFGYNHNLPGIGDFKNSLACPSNVDVASGSDERVYGGMNDQLIWDSHTLFLYPRPKIISTLSSKPFISYDHGFFTPAQYLWTYCYKDFGTTKFRSNDYNPDFNGNSNQTLLYNLFNYKSEETQNMWGAPCARLGYKWNQGTDQGSLSGSDFPAGSSDCYIDMWNSSWKSKLYSYMKLRMDDGSGNTVNSRAWMNKSDAKSGINIVYMWKNAQSFYIGDSDGVSYQTDLTSDQNQDSPNLNNIAGYKVSTRVPEGGNTYDVVDIQGNSKGTVGYAVRHYSFIYPETSIVPGTIAVFSVDWGAGDTVVSRYA